jgi:hypothetical protein
MEQIFSRHFKAQIKCIKLEELLKNNFLLTHRLELKLSENLRKLSEWEDDLQEILNEISTSPNDEYMEIIQKNWKQSTLQFTKLEKAVPKCTGHMNKISELLQNDKFDKAFLCLQVRLCFEEILNMLITFHNCPKQEGMPLGDRVLFLKQHIFPPVRLNCFFDLKEYSSLGLHNPIISTTTMDMRTIEKIIVSLRCVIEEAAVCLENKTVKPPGREVPGGKTYKTVMCRNWKKYSSCPHGEKCLFAHGEEEMRLNQAMNGQ